MKKFFITLMCIVMVVCFMPTVAFAYGGSIERVGITHAGVYSKNAVSVDLKNVNFESSVQVKLYSGDTPLTTATLQGVNPGSHGFLTCCIATEEADEYWGLTPWTPMDKVVPNKAVLVVDGVELDTETFTLDETEWTNLPGVMKAGGAIERVGLTKKNDILKNAVSVDLKDVVFANSVEVELYSDNTLLTTATLNTEKLTAKLYPYLTCCIATEEADEYWGLTPWTPMDKVVPNKAVLVVDGNVLDTKQFDLNADEWANLPGTKAPQSFTGGYGYTDPLRAAKDKAIKEVTNYVGAAGYEEAQQAEIKTIVDNAKKDIEAAKTADEIKAIEAAAKAELDKLKTAEEMALIRAIEETKFVARSKAVTLKNGKKAIKITWYDKNGKEVKFDGVEIFRSTKRYSGYGKEPIYVSKSGVYYNTAITPGTKYYYKVRGYVTIDGEKVYTDYSTKAWRTVK